MGDAASSRVPPAAAPKRRRGVFRALLPWTAALAAAAAGVWWTFRIPYDPLAIYRTIPARAAAEGADAPVVDVHAAHHVEDSPSGGRHTYPFR